MVVGAGGGKGRINPLVTYRKRLARVVLFNNFFTAVAFCNSRSGGKVIKIVK
jgi:hypothetical protein